MFWNKKDEFETLTRNAPSNLGDLGANLALFRERYAKTLANRRGVDDELRSVHDEGNGRAFRSFYERFYQQIADELQQTDARIAEYQRLSRLVLGQT